MYDYECVEPPLPQKLKEIIADGWTFPTDYPVVDNMGLQFDQARFSLKAAIAHGVTEYYADYRINSYVVDDFTQRLTSRLYITMSQHQYWLDQFLRLIDDNQFFYNDEEQNLTHDATSNGNTFQRTLDTPQNIVSDIDNFLTEASKGEDSNTGNETNHNTIHKSTLGDITVQFRNFAGFPNFMQTIIEAVRPCFIMYYGSEDINYGTTE